MTLAADTTQAGSRSGNDIPIVDTHQHLWDLSRIQPPWLTGAPQVLARTYGPADYTAATEDMHVVQAIYMEVDVDPKDQPQEADSLIALCREGKGPTVAAVISGRPAGQSFAAHIRRYAREKEIKGVRQVLHVDSTPAGYCLQPAFEASMNLLAELGLSYDLCMRPGELSDGFTLAKKCPHTRFIVDHCGNASAAAFLPKSSAFHKEVHDAAKWRDDMNKLASCDNVICKISGIIAHAPRGVAFSESLAPLVNHCLDSFGPDRVVFGGDWPVCLLGGSFAEWVTALKQIISNRPLAEQQKLLHGNARRFYGLAG